MHGKVSQKRSARESESQRRWCDACCLFRSEFDFAGAVAFVAFDKAGVGAAFAEDYIGEFAGDTAAAVIPFAVIDIGFASESVRVVRDSVHGLAAHAQLNPTDGAGAAELGID